MYIQNLSQSQNTFNGGFYLKGSKWPQYLKEKLIKNQGLFDELTAKNDVFVRLNVVRHIAIICTILKGIRFIKLCSVKQKKVQKSVKYWINCI